MTTSTAGNGPDRSTSSLKTSALRGGLWTALGFGLSQVMRLAGNIVLAALLFEEAFAVAAIAAAVLQGIAMFSDLGIGPSVVQSRRGDEPAFLNTAWSMQIVRAVLVTAVAILLSRPLAGFYAANDPLAAELVWMLPLAAVSMLLPGFASPALLTAARHIHLGRVTLLEIGAQIVGLTTMLYVAWVTGSVYSLVVGGVVQSAVSLVFGYVIFKAPRPRFNIEGKAFWEIFHFGKWLFVSTFLSFLAMQFDKFAFAAAYPLQLVGVYTISAGLAALAPTLLGRIQLMVAFPLYSRVLGAGGGLHQVFAQMRNVTLVLGAFMTAMVIGTSEVFVALAYDERYAIAARIIPVLMLAAWFAVVESVYGTVFLATGKPRLTALTNFTKVVSFTVLFLVAHHYDSFMGAVFALAAADLIKAAVAVSLGHALGFRGAWVDGLWTAFLLVVGGVVMLLGRWLSGDVGMHLFGVILIQAMVVALAFSWWLLRSMLKLKSMWNTQPR